MMKTRTAALVSSVALGAAVATAAPASAAPATSLPTAGVVQYIETGASTSTGSLENEVLQAGLILVAGLGVSIALAAGAGVAGGAFELPQIPGLPF